MTIEVWHTGVFIGLLLFAGLACFTPSPKNALLFVANCYFILSGVMVFANPWYQLHFPGMQALLNWQSAMAVVQLILIGIVVWRRYEEIWDWMIGVVALNSLAVILFGHGLMHAGSLDAAMAMVVLPIALERWGKTKLAEWCIWGLVLTTLAVGGGVTGWMAGIAALSVIMWVLLKDWMSGAVVLTFCLIVTGLGYIIAPGFFNSWGRFDEWQRFMTWWWENARLATGTGLGTFELMGPLIQQRETNVWFFMHNEYLQVLFETGIIGFGLGIAVWWTAIKRAWSWPALVSSMAAGSVVLFTQFPLRFFLGQVLFALLLVEGWKHEKPCPNLESL